jgi:hypothetical protein
MLNVPLKIEGQMVTANIPGRSSYTLIANYRGLLFLRSVHKGYYLCKGALRKGLKPLTLRLVSYSLIVIHSPSLTYNPWWEVITIQSTYIDRQIGSVALFQAVRLVVKSSSLVLPVIPLHIHMQFEMYIQTLPMLYQSIWFNLHSQTLKYRFVLILEKSHQYCHRTD